MRTEEWRKQFLIGLLNHLKERLNEIKTQGVYKDDPILESMAIRHMQQSVDFFEEHIKTFK